MYIKVLDNVLPEDLLLNIDTEINGIKWLKEFDRAGSYMLECNDIVNNPLLNDLNQKHSSQQFLNFIEKEIGISGILPDPFLIGAGYSQIKECGDLKPHIDFNWNDRIKLYRVATYIIYLTTPQEGGELEFIGKEKIAVKRNRAVLFSHSEKIRHFVHPVKGVRNAVRFFYYSSMLERPDNYHRSLYGVKNNIAVDIDE